jgi:hypothetical protein
MCLSWPRYCGFHHKRSSTKAANLRLYMTQVDLGFVASLLACKWFIPVWVSELPRLLLVELWEAMLCEKDGTFLHLLLALHFVRLACDSLAAKDVSILEYELKLIYCSVLIISISKQNTRLVIGKPASSTKRYWKHVEGWHRPCVSPPYDSKPALCTT